MTPSGHIHGKRAAPFRATGKLRIGDDWNAITIIALSQENPLKAVAEFAWCARISPAPRPASCSTG